MNIAYHVKCLYANGFYVRDERPAINLVSWIETFIVVRGIIIQMMPMKWCNNIFDKQILLIECKNNKILNKIQEWE